MQCTQPTSWSLIRAAQVNVRWGLFSDARNESRILMGKPEGRKEGKRPLGRSRHRWEVNIEMYVREIGWGGVDRLDLAQDRDQWPADVSIIMNLRVPWNVRKLSSSWLTSGFWGKTKPSPMELFPPARGDSFLPNSFTKHALNLRYEGGLFAGSTGHKVTPIWHTCVTKAVYDTCLADHYTNLILW
jgi:hypothetical protein